MNKKRRWWTKEYINKAIEVLKNSHNLDEALNKLEQEFERSITYDSLANALARNQAESPFNYLGSNIENVNTSISTTWDKELYNEHKDQSLNENDIPNQVELSEREEVVHSELKSPKPKMMVIISDLHCGHKEAITPPYWHKTKAHKDFWDWFSSEARNLGHVDLLVVNGDAIDGTGKKSKSVELITSDRREQVDMALECINQFSASRTVIVAGTPYHTGKGEDWEHVLADKLDATFCDNYRINIDNKIFDFRHFISGSSVPHSRATAILRELMWANLKDPNINVVVRSHVHYYVLTRTKMGYGLVTPCLQIDSRLGKRKCSGDIDVGFVFAEIKNDKIYWDGALYM